MPRKKMAKAASSKLGIAKRAAKRNKMPSDDVLKMFKKYGEYKPPKAAKAIKKVPKASIAKRVLGKTLSKAIPGAGAAIIARDVVKGISKATCTKRGGKWVSGKCSGARKTKLKAGSKVRDPISKR